MMIEIMLKGISLSKEEKFPSEKEMNKIKKEKKKIKNSLNQ